jgi:hypothetical protein
VSANWNKKESNVKTSSDLMLRKGYKNNIQHRLIMVGNSHIKGMAANIKPLLEIFEVCGLVKPGSNSNSLVTTTSHDIENLTDKDILLVCFGSNDLGVTQPNKILQNIMNFTSGCNRTNIILVKIPPCYDTVNTNQVNNEIKVFNNK